MHPSPVLLGLTLPEVNIVIQFNLSKETLLSFWPSFWESPVLQTFSSAPSSPHQVAHHKIIVPEENKWRSNVLNIKSDEKKVCHKIWASYHLTILNHTITQSVSLFAFFFRWPLNLLSGRKDITEKSNMMARGQDCMARVDALPVRLYKSNIVHSDSAFVIALS